MKQNYFFMALLDLKLLKKFYIMTFINEDDNNLKIKANDNDINYLFY